VSVCVYTSAVITIRNFSEKKNHYRNRRHFLGRLQSREKRLITCVMSVRPATFISTGQTCAKFYIGHHYVNKIQVLFKSDKNIGHFTWRRKCVFITNSIVTIKALYSSEIVSGWSYSRWGINITRRIVMLYVHCLSCYIKPSLQNFQAHSVHIRQNRDLSVHHWLLCTTLNIIKSKVK
jgi:hypothetical protein